MMKGQRERGKWIGRLKRGLAVIICLTVILSFSAPVWATEQKDTVADESDWLADAGSSEDDILGEDIITISDTQQTPVEEETDTQQTLVEEETDAQQTLVEEETDTQQTPVDAKTDIQVTASNVEASDASDDTGDETVEKKNGVVIEDGVYHYYIDGVMQKWLITASNGDRYYADSDGSLARNKVIKFSDTSIGWLYFGNDGKAKKWLITAPNGDRYYAGANGALVRNKVIRFSDTSIGWLYFGNDGKAKKWLITASNGDRYYAGANGALVRNKVIRFNDESIGWLYFGNDGKAKKWLITAPNGDRYYAGANGALVRNKVIRFSDTSIGWLYFGNDGKAKKWLITAPNGDRYYAGANGALVRNKLIKFNDEKLGWLYFGNDGKVQKGKIVASGGNYYYATRVDGRIMRTEGWIILNGNKYYASNGGVLLRNTWKQMGSMFYHFDSNCKLDKTTDEDPTNPMRAKAQQYSSNTRYLILVNKEKHVVAIFRGSTWNWTEIDRFVCSVGKPSTPSPTGQFNIPSKYPRSHPYFDSGAARCWYPTRIYGGYLFHSILYDQTPTPSSIYDVRLGVSVSHGCVRLALDKAKWIYDNIPIGTKVVLY